MGNQPDSQKNSGSAGFKIYVTKYIIIALALISVVVWAFSFLPDAARSERAAGNETAIGKNRTKKTEHVKESGGRNPLVGVKSSEAGQGQDKADHSTKPSSEVPPTESSPDAPKQEDHGDAPSAPDNDVEKTPSHTAEPHDDKKTSDEDDTPKPEQAPKHTTDKKEEPAPHGDAEEPAHADLPTGVAFVDATIAPLNYELDERFWRWRPNDIINLTDNVNNFQLGVLEVTRRTVVLLNERIARTGTTDAFNIHLQNAKNRLMVKASQYWFPSPESKYMEGLDELKKYRDMLMNGRGSFYTRTDNLIPLLSSYEDLLGSCDENLVRQKNQDGSGISTFKADDQFYYAKGVANSMATVLEAIQHDFKKTLESRNAEGLILHAIESCRQAAALAPLIVTNGALDGVFANHRANMAAPISHARFYIGQLIKTLST